MAASGSQPSERGAGLRRRVLDGLKHAFAVNGDGKFLSIQERALIDKVAQAVVRRGMATPAIMLLESVRPLGFIGSQALAFIEPVATTILAPRQFERFRSLLERRSTVSLLIEAIELHSQPPPSQSDSV